MQVVKKAAAVAASEQQLSDSEAAKARAEAKRAKKLRQKAKKQQTQHPHQAEEPQQVQLLGLHHHSQQDSPTHQAEQAQQTEELQPDKQQAQQEQKGRDAQQAQQTEELQPHKQQSQHVTQENRAQETHQNSELMHAQHAGHALPHMAQPDQQGQKAHHPHLAQDVPQPGTGGPCHTQDAQQQEPAQTATPSADQPQQAHHASAVQAAQLQGHATFVQHGCQTQALHCPDLLGPESGPPPPASTLQPDVQAAAGDMAGGIMIDQGSPTHSAAEAAAITEAQRTCHSLNDVIENLLICPLTQV